MASGTVIESTAPRPVRTVLRGWGGGPGAPGLLVASGGVQRLRDALASGSANGAIARGMGRSYGDAAQLHDGLVLGTGGLRGYTLDRDTGVLSAGAGMTIGELLGDLVPQGWMVPVVPGTQHVTLGGAVASDIHGKNHGKAGSFGAHVRGLELMLASGELVALSPGDDLFAATVGGMGLTGVIVRVDVALRPVTSALVSVDTDRVASLDDTLALLSGAGGPHRVAWLDLLGPELVRGVVTRAEHREGGLPAPARLASASRDGATVAARATIPAAWPGGLLRRSTIRAFNELRYRASPRSERDGIEPLGRHMFPLDALDAWPRLYGRAGFVQYQLVVPYGQESALEQVIERLRRSPVPCYLAVLKDFGPASGAPLSFPIPGWTLALDLPRAAPALGTLLDGFDRLVAAAGGRVYLSKDARMKPELLAAMYPRLDEWRAIRDAADPDGVWRSDLGLRVGLVGGGR